MMVRRTVVFFCMLGLWSSAWAGGDPPPPSSTPAAPVFSMPEDTARDWPFVEWSYAKAYLYNLVEYGPGAVLYVYRDGLWNKSIRKTYELTREQAEEAVALAHRTRGEMRVSKCPFPRHAVVLFNDSDEPVASINVCFSCGDILVWPSYYSNDPEPEEDEADDPEDLKWDIEIPKKKRKTYQKALEKMKAEDEEMSVPELEDARLIDLVYLEVMPDWKLFFGAEGIGAPLRPKLKKGRKR